MNVQMCVCKKFKPKIHRIDTQNSSYEIENQQCYCLIINARPIKQDAIILLLLLFEILHMHKWS